MTDTQYLRGLSRKVGSVWLGSAVSTKKKPKASKPKETVYKDGWYKVKGFDIYVEDQVVKRAMKLDNNGYAVSAQVYYRTKDGWTNGQGFPFKTVRNGIYKGTWWVF